MSENIYYNVLPDVPADSILRAINFPGAACFADWVNDYAPYKRRLRDEQSGHFVILLDAFITEYRWSHTRMLERAVQWLNDRGFTAQLCTTHACTVADDELRDGVPVLAISYEPGDSRTKIYHALCFARYFTREFIGEDRTPVRRSDLQTFFRWVFARDVDLDMHMPFVDAFVEGRYWYQNSSVPDVRPVVDTNLGAVYLAYLDSIYADTQWPRTNHGCMRPMDDPSLSRYWSGELTYGHWCTFYRTHIHEYTRSIEAQ